MIRRLKYDEIDFEKYQQCLENSEQYLFFSEKEYLDLMIGSNWEILLYKDYQAVMPIPLVNKMGFSLVLMPIQTQQLGIFSAKDDLEINEQFLLFFLKNYNIYYYSFNVKNRFKSALKSRKNFKLFTDTYENIRKKYSVHRRRNVRLLEKNNRLRFSDRINFEKSKDFFYQNIIGIKSNRVKENIYNNMKMFHDDNLLVTYELKLEDKIVSQAYLLKNKKEFFLINFINDKKYIKLNSTSILLDQIFQKNIHCKDFNFHGSNLPEIAEFYRRFGAREQTYHFINYTLIRILYNFIKNILFR